MARGIRETLNHERPNDVYIWGKAAPTSGTQHGSPGSVRREPLPALAQFFKERRVCACGRHVIDEYGDHIHTCKKHTGSTMQPTRPSSTPVEALCRQALIATERRNIPTIKKRNAKNGQGDLVLKLVVGHIVLQDGVAGLALRHARDGVDCHLACCEACTGSCAWSWAALPGR
jgi:hypothetical protein